VWRLPGYAGGGQSAGPNGRVRGRLSLQPPVATYRTCQTTRGRSVAAAMAHLREVLGDQTYESLARNGETMTTATMAT
jgi:hypothetical protein